MAEIRGREFGGLAEQEYQDRFWLIGINGKILKFGKTQGKVILEIVMGQELKTIIIECPRQETPGLGQGYYRPLFS